MRTIYFNLFALSLFSMVLVSCKKEKDQLGPGTSALTVINGVQGGSIFYTEYGNFSFFNSYSGKQELSLYQNTTPVYSLTLNLPVNTIHSLFVMGTIQTPDTLFTTDKLPYHVPADSVMGIRFVNISQGSSPVSVNIIGQANGSEAQNLAYKGVTTFKNYPANSTVSSYTFEFRDQGSGILLGSCTLDGINMSSGDIPNHWLNQNFTLALLGTPGGLATNGVLVVSEDVQQ